jgi:hypothetical protein
MARDPRADVKLFDNRMGSKAQAWLVPLLRFVQQC